MRLPGIDYKHVTKKYLFDLLQEHYQHSEQIIERITHYLVTEKDVKDFCQIVVDAYSKGYMKAVNDYKEQISKIGYKVEIKN